MRIATLLRPISLGLMLIGLNLSPAAPHDGATPQPVAGKVTDPELETKVAPEYPPEARDAELEASTILQAVIDRDGRVAAATIQCLHCSVRRRGEDPEEVLHGWCGDFCDAAAAAVAQWRYKPGMKDGEPVEIYFTIVVQFELQ